MKYYRTSTKLLPFEGPVWLKKNELKASRQDNLLIDDLVGLRIYDRANGGAKASDNSFQRDNNTQTNIKLNILYDEDLDVGSSSWLAANGSVLTDSVTIRNTIHTGIGDVFLSPILTAEELCAGESAFEGILTEKIEDKSRSASLVRLMETEVVPDVWSIEGPQPNPSDASTEMRFGVPMSGDGMVRMIVYNVEGRRVRVLVSSDLAPGHYRVQWDGRADDGGKASPGLYFIRLEGFGYEETRKFVRLK
jgi:hypothetical protein